MAEPNAQPFLAKLKWTTQGFTYFKGTCAAAKAI